MFKKDKHSFKLSFKEEKKKSGHRSSQPHHDTTEKKLPTPPSSYAPTIRTTEGELDHPASTPTQGHSPSNTPPPPPRANKRKSNVKPKETSSISFSSLSPSRTEGNEVQEPGNTWRPSTPTKSPAISPRLYSTSNISASSSTSSLSSVSPNSSFNSTTPSSTPSSSSDQLLTAPSRPSLSLRLSNPSSQKPPPVPPKLRTSQTPIASPRLHGNTSITSNTTS